MTSTASPPILTVSTSTFPYLSNYSDCSGTLKHPVFIFFSFPYRLVQEGCRNFPHIRILLHRLSFKGSVPGFRRTSVGIKCRRFPDQVPPIIVNLNLKFFQPNSLRHKMRHLVI